MPTPSQMLCAALAAGCVLSAAPAEARFGPSGGGRMNASSGKGSGGSGVHGASAVGQGGGRGTPPARGGGSAGQGRAPPIVGGPRRAVFGPPWVSGVGAFGPAVAFRPDPWRAMERQEEEEPKHPLMIRMGMEGGAMKRGGGLGMDFAIEGRRWGMSTRLTTLMFRPEDGVAGGSHLQLGQAHLTYTPVTHPRGRLRLEGGLAVTRVPGAITFIGPSMAASFERCLTGALDLEGRVQFVPVPHLQLDAQLALAVHVGVMTVRAGWRGLALNDQGYLDGTKQQNTLGGPFGGLGMSF